VNGRRVILGVALAIAGLIAVTGIGLLVAGGDDRVLGASGPQRSYVAGKYIVNIDGESTVVVALTGCGVFGDVVPQPVGADGVVRKHVSQPKHEPCVIKVGANMGKGLYNWVVGTLNRKAPLKDLSIIATDFNYKVQAHSELANALLTKVVFPGVDGSSKDATALELTIEPESWRKITTSVGTDAKAQVNVKQKTWLQSNFRLTIPGLDTTKVNRVTAFVATQKVAADAVGEFREYEKQPATLELGNLGVTSAASHSEKFHQWFDQFVIQGNNSQSDEKTATLEYLDPTTKGVLFTLSFSGVGIFRAAREPFEANKDNLSRDTFWLYVEEASFLEGAVAPPPPPPPPPPPSTTTTPPPPAPEPPPATTTEETVPTETREPELAPGPEKIEAVTGPEPGDIQLTWSPVAEAESYLVLMAREPGGPYEEIGETRRTSFIVGGLESKVPYYFVVRAVVFGDETADSPEASAPAG
jgi:hypothetical protein